MGLIEESMELGYMWSLAALFCAPLFPDCWEVADFSAMSSYRNASTLPQAQTLQCHLSMHRNL